MSQINSKLQCISDSAKIPCSVLPLHSLHQELLLWNHNKWVRKLSQTKLFDDIVGQSQVTVFCCYDNSMLFGHKLWLLGSVFVRITICVLFHCIYSIFGAKRTYTYKSLHCLAEMNTAGSKTWFTWLHGQIIHLSQYCNDLKNTCIISKLLQFVFVNTIG